MLIRVNRFLLFPKLVNALGYAIASYITK